MKNGWQYVQSGGTNEKMAPMTLASNVLMSENGPSLTSSMPSNPNLLINGDFRVWQRGEIAFNAPGYTADRWYNGNYAVAITKHAKGLQHVSADTWRALSQAIEYPSILAGKTTALSVKVYSSNCHTYLSIEYYRGGVRNVVAESSISAGATGVFSISGTLPNDLSDSDKLLARIGNSNTCGIIVFEYAKLEVGEAATPYVPRIYAGELALCQRYYLQITDTYRATGFGYVSSATAGRVHIPTPSTMRTLPSIVGDPMFMAHINGVSYSFDNPSVSNVAANLVAIGLTGTSLPFPNSAVFANIGTYGLDAEIY